MSDREAVATVVPVPQAVPAGTCLVKITMGSKFRFVGDITSAPDLPLSNYFHWSIEEIARSQFIITGELYRDMPAHFSGNATFLVMPFREGSSTATCQVLISNHNNPMATLSDVSPMNNFVSKTYTNMRPFGVKFTRFDAMAHGCAIDINWAIFDIDKSIRSYTVETSNDGFTFHAVKTIVSGGNNEGGCILDETGKKTLTVRVKAETLAGQFVYSNNVQVSSICSGGFEIGLYPNPVPKDITTLTIQAKAGIFNGKYSIRMTDVNGKELKKMDATFANQLTVNFSTGFIAAGSYIIAVTAEDGQTTGLKFVKQ